MTKEYKCPSCGGTICFDSTTQKMKCPYCDSLFDVESLKEYDETLKRTENEKDNISFSTKKEEWSDDDLMHYVCPSCGGEIITNETLASTVCPYCSNNVILTDKLSGTLKPDLVIPFKIDKKKAIECFKNSLNGKRYLSSAFKDENHFSDVKGVYVPVWLYSSRADCIVSYRAVTTSVWSDREYNYTQTNHFLLEREGNVSFEKIPVDGSKSMSDELMESLSPYDYSDAVDYNGAYLSGFLADKYDLSSLDCSPRAIERAKSSVERYFRKTTEGFSRVEKKSESINMKDGECKYALLPVWLLNTKWEDKNYLFAVNGQNGKFVGDLPFDKKRGIRDFVLGTTILSSLFFLLFYLVWAL